MTEKIIWKNEKRKLSELKPWERNPRQGTEKQYHDLEKSLDKFSLADPLVINLDNTIIGGHFRYKILRDKEGEGFEIDVRVPDRQLTEEEMTELNLRLNKNLGMWNEELLANFSEDLLKDVGFESEELDEIFGLEIDEEFDVEKEMQKLLRGGGIKSKRWRYLAIRTA